MANGMLMQASALTSSAVTKTTRAMHPPPLLACICKPVSQLRSAKAALRGYKRATEAQPAATAASLVYKVVSLPALVRQVANCILSADKPVLLMHMAVPF